MARSVHTGTEQLLCSVDAGVATMALNRPEKRNALGDIVSPAIRQTLAVLEADPEVRALIVTGVGKAFCSGGDVSGMGGGPTVAQNEIDKVQTLRQRQTTLTGRLYHFAKPTIAALPGPAAGAGMSIALACDLRLAAESAFLVSGFGRVGLSGDYGGSWFLNQLVGPAKTKEIYFTGRRIGAEEALSLGIVNEVVPDDALTSRATALAAEIAAGPPIAIGYMKQNINRAAEESFQTCLDWEADRVVRCAQTEDHKEAVAAFVEKRPPVFKGC